jgi:hypothetical protein
MDTLQTQASPSQTPQSPAGDESPAETLPQNFIGHAASEADYAAMLDFLDKFNPGEDHHLWAKNPASGDQSGYSLVKVQPIAPNNSAIIIDTPEDRGMFAERLSTGNKNFNLYAHVNPLMRVPANKKGTYAEVRCVNKFHAEIDISIERADKSDDQLRAEWQRAKMETRALLTDGALASVGLPPASIIIWSGGGWWVFWLLDSEVPVVGESFNKDGDRDKFARDISRYNDWTIGLLTTAVAAKGFLFKADVDRKVRDACRVHRLPFTVNIADDDKRKNKGRVGNEVSYVDHVDWNKRHAVSAFQKAEAEQTPPPPVHSPDNEGVAGASIIKSTIIDKSRAKFKSADELPTNLSDRTKTLITKGEIAGQRPAVGKDISPSGWAWDAACSMFRERMSATDIYAVLTSPCFGISRSALGKGRGADREADRTVTKAMKIVSAETAAKHKKPADENAAAVERIRVKNEAAGWKTNDDGKIFPEAQHNMRLAITKLGVVLKYNTFANRMLIERNGKQEILNDARNDELWFEIDSTFKFRPGYQLFQRFTAHECWRNSFHPVQDYLNGLQWDGVKRIDRWLTTYGGADDTEYTQAVGRIVLVAAVRRILHPGAKFDEMLILESEVQGKNKSTALQILSVKDEWFNDTIPLSGSVNQKVEAMQGKWIVEAGELHGMKEAGAAKLKNFLSSRTDCTRLAWEKKPDEYPRQCVIIGTTNKTADYFTDETGNRRFWPCKVRGFDDKALVRDRDQLWAEAAALEASGESIRLSPSLYGVAGEQQEKRREVSPIEDKLSPRYGPGTDGVQIPTTEVWDVLELHSLIEQQRLGREVGKIMRSFGWEKKRIGGERRYFYVREGFAVSLYGCGDAETPTGRAAAQR